MSSGTKGQHGSMRQWTKKLFSRKKSATIDAKTPSEPIEEDSKYKGPVTEPRESDVISLNINGNCPDQTPKQEAVKVTKSEPSASVTPSETTRPSASGSAYQQAWLSLHDDQRAKLASDETARSLVERLDKTAQDQKENSLLRKGMGKAQPYLTKVNVVVDLVSPFISLNPAASSAMSLVKGSTAVVIAICGAADELTDQAQKFLRYIPAIERCDSVVKDGRNLPDIHHTLVQMYKSLLQFYVHAADMLGDSGFSMKVAMKMAMSQLQSTTTGILDSFITYAGTLDILLQSETFATTQELKEGMVEALINDTLNTGRAEEAVNLDEFRKRAEEACKWIESDEGFSSWVSTSSDANALVMVGHMGSGKSMTTAHVVNSLSESGSTVCCYYCIQGQSTTNLGNIYRSLLWQLLRSKPDLRPRFYQWQKTTRCHIDPTLSTEKLEEFLSTTILSSPEHIFVAIDGLDECKNEDRVSLLRILNGLVVQRAKVKVFFSSRSSADIMQVLQGPVIHVNMHVSRDKDRVIAAYLVAQTTVPQEFHEKVVGALSSRADGSAIWLRIALHYLVRLRISNTEGLEAALAKLSSFSCKDLGKMYYALFEQTYDEDEEIKILLTLTLETLAAAHRPLKERELRYAVTLRTEEAAGISTIAKLDTLAFITDLPSLIVPFVSKVEVKGEAEPQYRLVHQSLKELITLGPPDNWSSVGGRLGTEQQTGDRSAGLNGQLLRCCIRYLLLEECGRHLLQQSGGEDEDIFGGMDCGMFDDDAEKTSQTSNGVEADRFDPSTSGLGHFFTYAASYWTAHLTDVRDDLRPTPEDMIALCRWDSTPLKNWVYQWCRPNCRTSTERDLPVEELDPLVVTAIFGPAALMTDILLNYDVAPPEFWEHSTWGAVVTLKTRGHIGSIRNLLEHPRIGQIVGIVPFFFHVVGGWSEPFGEQANTSPEWVPIFDLLIQKIEIRQKLLEAANEILCLAARNGCLVLIQRLFEAGKTDAELRTAILADTRKEFRRKFQGRSQGDHEATNQKGTNLDYHQSVGSAVWEGHTDVVHFLVQQEGIDDHLHYVNEYGSTVFHLWARHHDTEIFAILMQAWPEGLSIRDNREETPLHIFLFNVHMQYPEEQTIGYLTMLLEDGQLDASGKEEGPDNNTPLLIAAKGGRAKICRFLITEHSADLYSVLEVDATAEQPKLVVGVSSTPESQAQHEKNLLNELCSLAPLAVSTEYLF